MSKSFTLARICLRALIVPCLLASFGCSAAPRRAPRTVNLQTHDRPAHALYAGMPARDGASQAR